jgi:hypothetical protein
MQGEGIGTDVKKGILLWQNSLFLFYVGVMFLHAQRTDPV